LISRVYDEPFADSSQIPTMLVTRMARQHVTVALSGDGGDELFGGYERYFRTARWWRRREQIPEFLRTPAAAAFRGVSAMLPVGRQRDRSEKLAAVLGADHAGTFYREFLTYWKDPAEVLINAQVPQGVFDEPPPDDLFQA